MDEVDNAAHWFLSRNRFEEYGFTERLLSSGALASAIPELIPIYKNPMKAGFNETGALLLDGQLAGALADGGPYEKFEGTAAVAKQMSLEFCAELIW